MKSVFAIALGLALGSSAFAGTEVSYHPVNPFGGPLQLAEAEQISDISLQEAKLTNVSTLEKKVMPDQCPGDDSSCSSSSSIKMASAVKLTVTYLKQPSADSSADGGNGGPRYEEIYLKPSQLPSATLVALQSKTRLGSKEVNRYFSLKITKAIQMISEIDTDKTQYCEEHDEGPLTVCPGTKAAYRLTPQHVVIVTPVIR